MTRPLAFAAAFVVTSGVTFGLLSSVAIAKPKIALTPIEGDASGDVQEAVAEALESNELALIGSKEVNRAVDKLGDVADLTEKDFKKLANELEADAIVLGKLDKVGAAKTLKFRLYIHKKMARGFTVSFKDARSPKFRTLLHDKMVDKLGATAASDGDDDKSARRADARDERADDEEGDSLASKDRKDRKAKRTKDEGDEEAPRRSSRDDEDGSPAPEDDDEDEDESRRTKRRVAAADEEDEVEESVTARASGRRAANRVAIRLDVGASVVQRSFRFKSNPIPERPRNLTLAPVPGARFEAEIYPLAFMSPGGLAAGLGAAVEYDKTVSLKLTTTNAMGSYDAPVKQSRYSIGLRYRLALGKTDTSSTLTLGVGFGRRLFSPDLAGVNDQQASDELLRDAPSTEYTVIDPGLSFRIPVTRMVAFVGGGRAMLVRRTGPIQNGSSYGRAKVFGGQGFAALDVVLGSRLALRFSGEFAQIGYTFEGVGALSNGLDGDTSTSDVGGLADRSLGGAATLAVMY